MLGSYLEASRFSNDLRLDGTDGRRHTDHDIVVVGVIVEAAEPGLVGRTGLSERHEAGGQPDEDGDKKTAQRHDQSPINGGRDRAVPRRSQRWLERSLDPPILALSDADTCRTTCLPERRPRETAAMPKEDRLGGGRSAGEIRREHGNGWHALVELDRLLGDDRKPTGTVENLRLDRTDGRRDAEHDVVVVGVVVEATKPGLIRRTGLRQR